MADVLPKHTVVPVHAEEHVATDPNEPSGQPAVLTPVADAEQTTAVHAIIVVPKSPPAEQQVPKLGNPVVPLFTSQQPLTVGLQAATKEQSPPFEMEEFVSLVNKAIHNRDDAVLEKRAVPTSEANATPKAEEPAARAPVWQALRGADSLAHLQQNNRPSPAEPKVEEASSPIRDSKEDSQDLAPPAEQSRIP